MTAVASSCCGGCNAVLSTGEVEGGLSAALAELRARKSAAGWSSDDQGRVRCPICLGTATGIPATAAPPPCQPMRQFTLLEDV